MYLKILKTIEEKTAFFFPRIRKHRGKTPERSVAGVTQAVYKFAELDPEFAVPQICDTGSRFAIAAALSAFAISGAEEKRNLIIRRRDTGRVISRG